MAANPRLPAKRESGSTGYDNWWSMNRTNVVRAFRECGRDDIAAAYADFYLAGWEGYHSAFAETGAARRALLSAHGLFGEARRLLGST